MLTNTPDPTDVTARPAYYRLWVRSTNITSKDMRADTTTNVQWAEPIRNLGNAVWKFSMHPHTLAIE